jgi:HSP20 family protein
MLNNTLPDIVRHSSEANRSENLMGLLDSFWKNPFNFNPFTAETFPHINMLERDDDVLIEAEVPGIDLNDVEVLFQDNHVVLRGEKKFHGQKSHDSYHKLECRYGSFQRTILLPCKVEEDSIKAKYSKGVLTIKLPKKEEAKKKRIPINS